MKVYLKLLTLVLIFCCTIISVNANIDESETNDTQTLEAQIQKPKEKFAMPVYTNEIAAVVNDEVVTMERIRMDLAPLIQQIQLESRSEQEFQQKVSEAALEVLNNIINRKLVVNAFLEKGGKLSDTYEKKEYENYLQNVFLGNRLEFAKFLKEYGKSVREFKKDVKERAIINFMTHELRASQMEVSPAKIKEYYESHMSEFFKNREIELKQIVIFKDDSSASQIKLDKIDHALLNGETFENVAKEYSDNIAAYDMGYICPADLVSQIAEAVKETEIGTYTKHIELNDIIYIFFVANEHQEKQLSIEEASHTIEESLYYTYQEEARVKWLQNLRDKAYIKIYLEK